MRLLKISFLHNQMHLFYMNPFCFACISAFFILRDTYIYTSTKLINTWPLNNFIWADLTDNAIRARVARTGFSFHSLYTHIWRSKCMYSQLQHKEKEFRRCSKTVALLVRIRWRSNQSLLLYNQLFDILKWNLFQWCNGRIWANLFSFYIRRTFFTAKAK